MALSVAVNMSDFRYGQGVNVASAALGGVATASSELDASNVASFANNGERSGASGIWMSASTTQQWLQIDFGATRIIDEVDIFCAQDDTPVTPTQEMTFGRSGMLGFDIQFWSDDSSSWLTILRVRGNFRVWRRLILPVLITTRKIRLLSQGSPDGFSRIAEIEAWGQVVGQGNPLFTASGNSGTVNWETDVGAMSAGTGLASVLQPLNRTQVVTVTAEDSVTTVTKQIQINGTLPAADGIALQPRWGVEADTEMPMATWPMVYEQRDQAEYLAVLEFFNWHKKCVIDPSPAEDDSLVIRVVKGLPFYIKDIALGELQQVYFDSAIRRAAQAADWFDYSFSLRSFNYLAP